MKQNKFTWVALLMIGAVLAIVPVTSARAEDSVVSGTNNVPGKGARGERLQEILEKLGLSPEQRKEIRPVLKAQYEKLKVLKEDSALSVEAKKAKAREIFEATSAKLKGILTPAQFTKWEEIKKEHAANESGKANQGNALLPTTPTQ